jgi:hypothetical protein
MAGTAACTYAGYSTPFRDVKYERIMTMMALVLPLALLLSLFGQRSPEEPFVEVGVWYAGPGVVPPAMPGGEIEAIRRDLAAIRRAGFNGITTWIAWRDAEPREGTYALAGLERVVAAAVEAELRISVVVYSDPAPPWAAAKPDAASKFVDYVSKRLSLRPGILRVVEHSSTLENPPARIPVRPGAAPEARLAMWSSVARGARRVAFSGPGAPLTADVFAVGETAGVITRNPALFAPLRPRDGGVLGISGPGSGPHVEARILESDEALVIIGLNYAAKPSTVRVAFAADIPEAMWSNLETGTSMSFVMEKTGPVLDYTFGPRDSLVLMIRKRR